MTQEEVKKIIFDELKRVAPDAEPEKLQPDDNIRRTLDIDSFDALQFLVALDEKLGVSIPEEDYGKTDTLKNLLGYISSKMK